MEGGAWASAPFGALRLWDNGTGWSQIELEKGEFKWDNLEGALENATSKGMTDILYVLGTTPEWAAQEVNDEDYPQPGAASAPANLDDWDEWVEAVVTRYGDRITSYQIWNEANLANFYRGTPEEMAQMTKRAYDIIKANDPDALVVAPSPSTRLTGSFDRFFPEYLTELEKLDWPVDVWAVHTYPDGQGTPADRALLIEKFTDALEAAGAPELPIWDTEVNYGIAGPGDIEGREITGVDAAGYVVRTYIDDLRLGVERSYWYIWSLAAAGLPGHPGLPGLRRRARLLRPGQLDDRRELRRLRGNRRRRHLRFQPRRHRLGGRLGARWRSDLHHPGELPVGLRSAGELPGSRTEHRDHPHRDPGPRLPAVAGASAPNWCLSGAEAGPRTCHAGTVEVLGEGKVTGVALSDDTSRAASQPAAGDDSPGHRSLRKGRLGAHLPATATARTCAATHCGSTPPAR